MGEDSSPEVKQGGLRAHSSSAVEVFPYEPNQVAYAEVRIGRIHFYFKKTVL
jgi:hypothetical protein